MSFLKKYFGCRGTKNSPKKTKRKARDPASRLDIIPNINKNVGCFQEVSAMPPLAEKMAPRIEVLESSGSQMFEPSKKASHAQIFRSLWRRLLRKEPKKETKDGKERNDQNGKGMVSAAAPISVRTPKESVAPVVQVECSDGAHASEVPGRSLQDENSACKDVITASGIIVDEELVTEDVVAETSEAHTPVPSLDEESFSLEYLFMKNSTENITGESSSKEAISAYAIFLKKELAPAFHDAVVALYALLQVLFPDDYYDEEPFFLENLFMENPYEGLNRDSVSKDCLMVEVIPPSSVVIEETASPLEYIEPLSPEVSEQIEETSSAAKAYSSSSSERNDQEDVKSYGEMFDSLLESVFHKLDMRNVEGVNGMLSAGMPDQRGDDQQAGSVSERTPKHKNFVRKAISKWSIFRKRKASPAAENLPYVSVAPSAAEDLQYASIAPPAPPAPSLNPGEISSTDIFLSDPDEEKEVSASKFTWLCIRKKADMKRRMKKKQVQARFKIVGELGRGAFGSVVKIRQKRGRKDFALKEMRGPPAYLVNVPNEINAIKLTSDHPLFVRFYSFYSFTYQDGTLEFGIITELFPSQSLNWLRFSQVVSRLEAKFIFFQLGVALKFLHSLNIIHCDVKTENVLVNKNMEIKLIDLGLCRKGPYSVLRGGTEGYEAPEIVCLPQNVEDRKPYTFTVDYYSCGAVLHDLLYGEPPAVTGAYLEFMGVLLQYSLGTRRWALPVGHEGYGDEITKEDVTFVAKLLNDSPEARPDDKTFLTDVYFASLPPKFKAPHNRLKWGK